VLRQLLVVLVVEEGLHPAQQQLLVAEPHLQRWCSAAGAVLVLQTQLGLSLPAAAALQPYC
jgi:hypothetical protein